MQGLPWPITGINKKLGPGIDTRCFGGYVLPPPSYVNRRRYELLDAKWTGS